MFVGFYRAMGEGWAYFEHLFKFLNNFFKNLKLIFENF
jgi:hypothetical protein